MFLQALDTIHVSSVSSDNILTGQSFEIDDLAAVSLIKRGLAMEVGAKAQKSGSDVGSKSEITPEAELEETQPTLPKSGTNSRNKAG